jgi:hypothetical protein
MALVEGPGQVKTDGTPRPSPYEILQRKTSPVLIVGNLDLIPRLPDRTGFDLDTESGYALGRDLRSLAEDEHE